MAVCGKGLGGHSPYMLFVFLRELIFSGKVVKIGFAQSLFDSSEMTLVTNAVDKRREVKLDNLILITNKDANATENS